MCRGLLQPFVLFVYLFFMFCDRLVILLCLLLWFLAHLSRRLIGELIVYHAPASGVVVVVVVVHNFQTSYPQKVLGQSEPNFM